MDLNPMVKPEEFYKDGILDNNNFITASAKSAMNIPYLKSKLEAIVLGNPNPEQTIVSNSRHYEALLKAQTALDAVLQAMDHNLPGDLMAMDIRSALEHLGEITGDINTDDLLDSIFTRFCIGK